MNRKFDQAILLLLFVWVPLAFFNRAADGFTLPKELVAAAAIAFFLGRLGWEGRWVFRQGLAQVLAAFTLWMVLDSLAVGTLKMEALKGSLHFLLMVGTFLAVVWVCSRWADYEKIVHFSLLAGVFIALLGLLQSLGWDGVNWTTRFEKRAFSTLGNPDYLGGYLAALLPLAFLLTLRALGGKKGWLWLNVTLALTAGLFATHVRGAELAALAGFVFLGFFLFTPGGKELARRNRFFLVTALALVLGLGGAWAALHWKDFSRSQISVQQRLETYQVAWEMVKDHPWLGIGAGQFGVQFPQYQWKPWAPQDYSQHPYTYSEHVHNEFLQFWVEGGLPGFLLFLAVLVFFALESGRFLRDAKSPIGPKELLAGVGGSVLALLVQSLSNFPLQLAPTAVLFGLLLAAPLALRPPSVEVLRKPVSTIQKIVLAFMVLVTAVLGLKAVAASIAFRDTMGESSAGNGKLAAYYGVRLLSLSPVNPKAWNAYGKAMEVSGQAEPACAAYQKALELNPNASENWVSMARIRMQQGRFAEAVDLCGKALSITPNYPMPVWVSAICQYQLKHYGEAARLFDEYSKYSPDNFESYLNLGVCYIQMKRKADAVAAWNKAYRLNPQDPQLLQYLKANGAVPVH